MQRERPCPGADPDLAEWHEGTSGHGQSQGWALTESRLGAGPCCLAAAPLPGCSQCEARLRQGLGLRPVEVSVRPGPPGLGARANGAGPRVPSLVPTPVLLRWRVDRLLQVKPGRWVPPQEAVSVIVGRALG